MRDSKITRRELVKSASGAAAFSLMPASALGANERIRFGVIGVGGMGTGHVGSLTKRGDSDNVQVVAVSDVYRRRITRAVGLCKGEGYPDYRKLLERKDVDAILIATPDHWHAKVAMD